MEGEHGGLLVAYGGAEELGGRLGVVALDGEDDEVELGAVSVLRAFDGVDVVDLAGSGFAEHAEAVVADGLEVGAAGDEGNVVAGLDEAGADESADAAGAHDQDVHGGFISFWPDRGANCGLWVGRTITLTFADRARGKTWAPGLQWDHGGGGAGRLDRKTPLTPTFSHGARGKTAARRGSATTVGVVRGTSTGRPSPQPSPTGRGGRRRGWFVGRRPEDPYAALSQR